MSDERKYGIEGFETEEIGVSKDWIRRVANLTDREVMFLHYLKAGIDASCERRGLEAPGPEAYDDVADRIIIGKAEKAGESDV